MIKLLNIAISATLLVLIFSCEKGTTEKKEYFDNGSIKSLVNYKDSTRHGSSIEYYRNGKIKKTNYWVNGKLNGEEKDYDSLGNIVEVVNFKEGKLNGKYLAYYKSGSLAMDGNFNDGILHGTKRQYFDGVKKLEAEIHYVNFQGIEKEMGSVWYDTSGNVIREFRRVVLNSKIDTIEMNDSLELDLELRKPRFDSTFFVIGNYDKKFYLLDSSNIDTLKAVNHRYKLINKVNQQGENYIRGYAMNWRLISRTKEETREEFILPLYFEYKYFVK